jgi:hypothetical protein
MAPEPKDWLDIPDPWGASPPSARKAPPSPPAASPTRADLKRRRVVALVASLAWAGAVLALFGFREELADNAGLVAGQAALWSAFVALALALAIGKGRRGLGSPVDRARVVALGAPLAFLVAALFWLPRVQGASFGATGPLFGLVACFTTGVVVAIPMIALSLWSVRRSFPSAAGWRGALLGAASGLGAVLVLTLHCGSPFGGHVALAHGMPLVLSSLAGAWLGTRFARA